MWPALSKRLKTPGVRDSGSGDTTVVDVRTLLEAFLENFRIQTYFLQLPKYHDVLSIISFQIKGILLCMFHSHTMTEMKVLSLIHTHCMVWHVCTIFM
jgi:hypothetical protein